MQEIVALMADTFKPTPFTDYGPGTYQIVVPHGATVLLLKGRAPGGSGANREGNFGQGGYRPPDPEQCEANPIGLDENWFLVFPLNPVEVERAATSGGPPSILGTQGSRGGDIPGNTADDITISRGDQVIASLKGGSGAYRTDGQSTPGTRFPNGGAPWGEAVGGRPWGFSGEGTGDTPRRIKVNRLETLTLVVPKGAAIGPQSKGGAPGLGSILARHCDYHNRATGERFRITKKTEGRSGRIGSDGPVGGAGGDGMASIAFVRE